MTDEKLLQILIDCDGIKYPEEFVKVVRAEVIKELCDGVEMPEPWISLERIKLYLADQMREYAAAAVAKEREYSVAMDVAHTEATSDILWQLKTLTAERDALLVATKDQLASYRDAILRDAEVDFRSSGNKK